MILTSVLLLQGCDVGSPSTEPVDLPPVKLTGITATTGYDAAGRPVQSSFFTGSIGSEATSSASIHLAFDRYLLPASVSRQAICVRPATTPVTGPADCTQGQFFSPTYDPVRREVVLRLSEGARLDKATEYTVTVLRPTEDGASGIRAFDWAPLEQTMEFVFRTSAVDPPGAPAEGEDELAYVETDAFCSQSAICLASCAGDSTCEKTCQSAQQALSSCAFGGCHAEGGRTLEGSSESVYIGPAMGLILCTQPPGSAACPVKYLSPMLATAIGKVAHQTQQGENGRDGDVNPVLDEPRRFGRAMPIIDPGNPGNSYLLYKILRGIDPLVVSRNNPAAPGENERLGASVVVGMAMPANGYHLTDGVSRLGLPEEQVDSIQVLSDWIARGAPTSFCPL